MTYSTPALKLVGRATGIVLGGLQVPNVPDRIFGVPNPPFNQRFTTDGVLDADDGYVVDDGFVA